MIVIYCVLAIDQTIEWVAKVPAVFAKSSLLPNADSCTRRRRYFLSFLFTWFGDMRLLRSALDQ